VQKSRLLKTYKDRHPEILKIDAQIQQVAQKIDGELHTMLRAVETEYRVAKAREETLLGTVNQLRREGQDLNEKEIQYQDEQRSRGRDRDAAHGAGPSSANVQPHPEHRRGPLPGRGCGADDRILRYDDQVAG
jgi:hypothetical protein